MCFSNGIACKDRLARAFVAFSQRLCTASLRASLRREALDADPQVVVTDTGETNWTVSSSVSVCGGGGLGNASRYKPYSPTRNASTYTNADFTCDEFLPARYAPNRGLGVCEDVDECLLDTHTCNPQEIPANWTKPGATEVRCSNTMGSFACVCDAGYKTASTAPNLAVTQGGMPLECIDQDECLQFTHNCHTHATCTNTEGSYTCSCNRYLKGDGVVDCWDGQMDCRPAIILEVKTASGDACWARLSNLTSETGGPAAGSYCDDHAGTTGKVFVRFFWLESQTWSEERQLVAGDGYREKAPDLRAGAVTKGVLQGLLYVGTPAMIEYRVEGNNAWHPLTIEIRKYNDAARYVIGDPSGLGVGEARRLLGSSGSQGMCWVDGDGCVAEGICYTMLGSCGVIRATAQADLDECELGLETCHRNATCINLKGLYRCDCAAGFYGTGTGLTGSGTECYQCPAGKYSDSGAAVCTVCASYPLSVSPPESTSAASCGCRSGYYGNILSPNGTCQECPPNFYCPGGAEELPCPANSSSPRLRSVRTDCVCDEGFYGLNGDTCVMCPPGSECIGGWFKEMCPAGKYAGAYSRECTKCQRNSSSSAGAAFCQCNGGFETSGSRRLVTNGTCYLGACAPVHSQHDCTAAANALALGGGNLAATPVQTNETGPEACIWNVSNSVLEWVKSAGACTPERPCLCDECSERQCLACADGSFSAPGATACTDCPLNSFSFFPASFVTECVCSAAFYRHSNSGGCSICPPDATSAIGSTSLSDCGCKPGYSGDTDVNNVRCVESTYSGDTCILPFIFAGQIYTTCTSTVSPAFESGSINTPAAAQTYQRAWCAIATPPSTRADEEAWNNTAQQDWYAHCNCTGQCRMCEAGTYKGATGQSPCLECAVGKYSGSAASECALCPVFKTSPALSTVLSACQCIAGFNESATSGDCMDVNECDASTACSDWATCNNTFGSFSCSCNAGYHGNGTLCDACDAGYSCDGDVSKPEMCVVGTYSRVAASSCTSCPGNSTSENASEYCNCVAGYVGDGGTSAKRLLTYPNSTCLNEDECVTNSHNCDQVATCTDTIGSFTCTCPASFPGNGTVCASVCGDGVRGGVEQCDDGNADTGDGCESCVILPGWNCSQYTVPEVCRDLDECSANVDNCHASATCHNTQGSFTCVCDANWFGEGTQCTACTTGSQSTSNSSTEHDCTCVDGFVELVLNRTTATLLDSSATETSGTSHALFVYSFECSDVDECVQGSSTCGLGMACNNTLGSFLCECLTNYVRVDDNSTLGTFDCEDRDECVDASNDCDANALCNNTVGSFTCTCNTGYYDSSPNITGDAGSCQMCKPSTYSDQTGASSCWACPVNSTSMPASVDRSNCTCNAGYAGSIETESGLCVECKPGFFSGPSQLECCECAAGATSLPGSAKARDCFCDSGFYGDFPLAVVVNSTFPANTTVVCEPGGLMCSGCPPSASSQPKSVFKSNCSCVAGYYLLTPDNSDNFTNHSQSAEGKCTACDECEEGYARLGCSQSNAGRCEDINECSTTPGSTPVDGVNNCDPNARCVNLNKTFECNCKEDFYGNGSQCKYVLFPSRVLSPSRCLCSRFVVLRLCCTSPFCV